MTLETQMYLIAYIRPLEITLAKKTTELVFLFHKNIIKASISLAQYGFKKLQSVKLMSI